MTRKNASLPACFSLPGRRRGVLIFLGKEGFDFSCVGIDDEPAVRVGVAVSRLEVVDDLLIDVDDIVAVLIVVIVFDVIARL
jgi:hypothetical protein